MFYDPIEKIYVPSTRFDITFPLDTVILTQSEEEFLFFCQNNDKFFLELTFRVDLHQPPLPPIQHAIRMGYTKALAFLKQPLSPLKKQEQSCPKNKQELLFKLHTRVAEDYIASHIRFTHDFSIRSRSFSYRGLENKLVQLSKTNIQIVLDTFLIFICQSLENHESCTLLNALIQLGADVTTTDKYGKTALEHLLAKEYPEVHYEAVLLLLKAGADPKKYFSNGMKAYKSMDSKGWPFYELLASKATDQTKHLIAAYVHPISTIVRPNDAQMRSGLQEREQVRDRWMRFSDTTISNSSPLSNHNLTPSTLFQRKALKKTYPKYEEFLTPEQANIQKNILHYLETRLLHPLDDDLKEIIHVLQGRLSVHHCSLFKDNALRYLMLVKLLELTIASHNQKSHDKFLFPHSSLFLRMEILRLCSPDMTTAEAFTKTLHPRKYKDRSFLQNPANWIPERVCFHMTIIANQLIQAANKCTFHTKGNKTIHAVRGGLAFGKSSLLKTERAFEKCFKQDPDNLKYQIKLIQRVHELFELPNGPVHDEGVILSTLFKEGITTQSLAVDLSVEGCFSTVEDFETQLLLPAKDKGFVISLSDLHHAELDRSLYRILTRDPRGRDSCPSLFDIVKRYRESIAYRKQLLELIKNEPAITSYRLYVDTSAGQRILALEKKEGKLIVHDKLNLEASLESPSDACINQTLNTLITQDSLEEAVARNCMSREASLALSGWADFTLGQAVDYHIRGISVKQAVVQQKIDHSYALRYGQINYEPLQGDWLTAKYPNLFKHIQTEQQLHLRGVDEKGYGIYFPSGTFSSRLNPSFNPEKGIQMRLGYFILPADKADILTASKLSSHIRSQIEISCSGKLGYRLFVHPEAYYHFRPLHDAGVIWITPENSEFMGTPTSSYRSWLIRNTKSREVPFIVKMGVASSPTDTAKLLTHEEIKRGIINQEELNALDTDVQLFQETLGLLPKSINSGIIIREIPERLLTNSVEIMSLSALISTEKGLPYIYKLIDSFVKKGIAQDTSDFLNQFFNKGFFNAIEKLYLQHTISFSPHAQNVCVMISKNSLQFVLRDFSDMQQNEPRGFTGTYAWFWRYHVCFKLLLALIATDKEKISLPGAPTILNSLQKPLERPLFNTVSAPFSCYSISIEQAAAFLKKMDQNYIEKLSHYFAIKKIGLVADLIPAAECGSADEGKVSHLDNQLWRYRITHVK